MCLLQIPLRICNFAPPPHYPSSSGLRLIFLQLFSHTALGSLLDVFSVSQNKLGCLIIIKIIYDYSDKLSVHTLKSEFVLNARTWISMQHSRDVVRTLSGNSAASLPHTGTAFLMHP